MLESTDIILHLVRHTESVANRNEHLVIGRSTDAELTANGIAQAECNGRTMRAIGLLPDKVYATPARRGSDAMRRSLCVAGLGTMVIVEDKRLHEMGHGPWEGEDRARAYAGQQDEIARLGKDFKLSGGESMNDVAERMLEFFRSLRPLRGKVEPTRVVASTHKISGACAAGHPLINNWSQAEVLANAKRMPYGGVATFVGRGDRWRMVGKFGVDLANGETPEII